MEGSSLSAAATTRMVGAAAAMVSFAETRALLRELARVAVDPKQVERTAEALGAQIADEECHAIEEQPAATTTMYLGLDATGYPGARCRPRGARRHATQRLGSARRARSSWSRMDGRTA